MKRSNPSSERASTSQKSSQKKTRFISPEEDPNRFAEDVDAQLEYSKNATRKGRVKTEGYDSDSSDDGEGVVLSRRKDAAGDKEEDEDDMFVMGDKEKAGDVSEKKKAEYMRLGDIEGQEFNDGSRSGGEDSEVSEDDPEDEDGAEKRKKAGMGFELSSFNMREEMEEGKFTEDGSFVRTFDPHAIHDRWLDDTDEREMKKARRAKRALERAEREKLRAEAREAQQSGSKVELEKAMLTILKRGESVLEALARLGEKAKKARGKEKSSRKSRTHDSSMDVDSDKPRSNIAPTSTKQSAQKPQIEHLTDLASNLMSLGDIDIYNKTYEHLLRSVRSTGGVEPDWIPPAATYEYKWDLPEAQAQNGNGEDARAFGPFSEDEMKAWYGANYFGESGQKVKVRVIGGEWGDWGDVVD